MNGRTQIRRAGARMSRWATVVALAAATMAVSTPVEAQRRARQRVTDLNRDAMSAYHDLDLERAQALLGEALELCQSNDITDTPLARTYVNMGVVAIGGGGDRGVGMDHFLRALNADENIQLDPDLSTPDIESVFTMAQRRHAAGGSPSETAPAAPTGDRIPHQPVAEQLIHTPLPVYITTPEDLGVGRMLIYYRTTGMRRFERAEMARMGQGFGFEIPCVRVQAPSVRYYIVAYDEDGEALGFAGSQREPYEVSVVNERTMDAPMLPGREAPAQCTDVECPEGGECTQAEVGGEGDICEEDSQCGDGLVCGELNECIADDSDRQSGGPSFWIQFGGGVGAFLATDGMVADRRPPPDNAIGAPPGDWNSPEFASFIDPSTGLEGCNPGPDARTLPLPDGTPQVYEPQSECHVRVTSSGLLPNGGIHLGFGGYFSDTVGFAVGVRASMQAGRGTLGRIHFNARLQFRVTEPTWEGFDVALFAGLGVGQIQLRPKQESRGSETVVRPFIQTGLLSVQAGANLVYRIVNGFGIYFEPRGVVLLPVGAGNTVTFGLDFAMGVQIGLGN